ncbi:MAG: uroporphyrinogen-III C-methyltransferase [Gammaproteobacteria bacterium]|nr:uroporphyrinogen-III C-methyltransferase [Gammaproteobacteria bacterium]
MTENSNSSTAGAHHDVSAVRTDTSKVLEELSKSNAAKSPQQERRKRGLRRFLIILVLLVPVLFGLSFLVYQQSRISAELAQLRSDNAALEAALRNIPDVVAPAQTATIDPQLLDELRADIGARIEALAATVTSVQDRLAAEPQERGNEDWLWTESEYLLRLANQKLQLEGDTESALLLLTTVDSMLSEATAPVLFRVREAIAAEIMAVRSIEAVDVTGLYARLGALVPMVEQLSLRSALVQNYNGRLAQQQRNINPDMGFMARSLELLGSVFVWQRWDVAPEALLPPQQEAVLKQNLRLMVEQAQLALLAEEAVAYRDSLARSREWIARYFSIDSGVGRTVIEEMASLAEANIVQSRPDISGSLEALLQISENRLPSVNNDGIRP